MVYLTDVAEGGYTAFPRLNISIAPKKGDAAFWCVLIRPLVMPWRVLFYLITNSTNIDDACLLSRFNLTPDMQGDGMTLHGGCPVLTGLCSHRTPPEHCIIGIRIILVDAFIMSL